MKQKLLQHPYFRGFLLATLLLLGGGIFNETWADTTLLTLDCATPAPTGSTSTTMTAPAIATFLNSAAGLTSQITCSAKTGDVYKGKGSGGGDIPQQCLKIGKASGGGSFTFTIPNTYDQIDEVELTCYGWKTTSSISINSGTAQTFKTAQTEVTKTFELDSSTRTITIAVTTSAVCVTEIVLKSKITTYTITYSATNGSISGLDAESNAVASGAEVAEGATVTLTATPESGYTFDSWSVTGTSSNLSSTSDNPTTFTMGIADATVTANFISSSTVATPTFTVSEGTYNAVQSIEINCGTDDATIYYTTDGTDPTTSSSEYSSEISVTQTTTIKAFAVKDGLTDSDIASATYTLKCVAPSFDPAAGSVSYGTAIALSTTTEGATIYYTTNGDTPTSSSSAYNSSNKPTVTGNQTFKAIATKSGWSDSDVSSAAYTYYYVITSGSNNDSYGTVSGTTTITATPEDGYRVVAGDGGYTVASGTATVVNNGDNTFTVTPTSNCTVQINFEAIPTHTVTFSINGDVSRTATVAEGSAITFPTAKDTPADATEFNKTHNGKTFVGWYTSEYTHASTAPSYVNTATATMSTSDVTYYAVYADVEEEEEEVTKSFGFETSSTDDWTLDLSTNQSVSYSKTGLYSGKTNKNHAYVTFKDKVYVTNFSFEFLRASTNDNYYVYIETSSNGSSWTAVESYAMSTFTTKETWYNKSHTFDGKTALYVRFHCYNTTADRYVDDVTIKYNNTSINYSNFTTDARSDAGIAFANAEVDKKLSSGYTGQVLTNPNSVTVSYSSSDPTVATVNSSTGAITELLKAGSTTITATFAGNATYKPAEVSYTLNVTEKTPAGLAYATDEVEKLTTDDAFTNTLTNGYSLTVSYSSSATGVATVNASTGEVTIKGAGETTITATFEGDEDYEAGNASYTLTVSKAAPTLSFASDNAIGREGEEFAGNALTNPANLTVTYSSSDTDVATVNSSTGAVTIVADGTTTITASFVGNDTYTPGSASYTLKVLDTPTITVSDDEVAYGETFTVDDSGITGGAITVTSGNTSIATVEGLEITPKACGSVTITVSTAEDETYKAGEKTFTLTVTAPEGKTTAPSSLITTTFTDKDLNYSSGGVDWSTSINANSFESSGSARGVQFGAAKGEFTISNSSISGVITKVSMVVSTNDSGNTISVKVGDTDFKYNDANTLTLASGDSKVTRDFIGEASGNIVISCNNTKKSMYFMSISVTIKTDEAVNINKYGYATYCSVNPIDFSSTEGYTAWRVSDIDADGTITFNKITEKIKGGQGVLLYNKNADGENKSSATITFADGTTEFTSSENMLMGTTAPKYVEAETVYGLSGDKFVVNNVAGNIPANRAFIEASSIPAEVKNFTFVFEDETTGITETRKATREEVEAIFNLSGQKLNKMQRGINIVNGKKVIIK